MRTLVLNAGFEPLAVVSFRRALVLVMTQKATVVAADVEHPVHGPLRTVGVPLRIEGADIGPRGPAPGVGEHTREVLEQAGLTATEVAELLAAGVVAGPAQAGLSA